MCIYFPGGLEIIKILIILISLIILLILSYFWVTGGSETIRILFILVIFNYLNYFRLFFPEVRKQLKV